MKKLERKIFLHDLLFLFYTKQKKFIRKNMLPFECVKAHVWGKFYPNLFYFIRKFHNFFKFKNKYNSIHQFLST